MGTHSSFLFAGLAYLHSLSPRLVHKNFRTANVLVDENFIAKVADAGIRNFLGKDMAGPSSQVIADEIFLSPEYYSLSSPSFYFQGPSYSCNVKFYVIVETISKDS